MSDSAKGVAVKDLLLAAGGKAMCVLGNGTHPNFA